MRLNRLRCGPIQAARRHYACSDLGWWSGAGSARSLDRYLRAPARHGQAHRPRLWLGMNNRGPLPATGIYQIIARRGRQCGVRAYPHRFRHLLSA